MGCCREAASPTETYIYVYIYECLHTHTHTHTYTSVHTYVNALIWVDSEGEYDPQGLKSVSAQEQMHLKTKT